MKRLSLLFKDSVFRKNIASLLIALVAVLAVMTASALTVTSTPIFCGLCHEMTNDHSAWAKSSHKNVTCIACHIPPNIVGFAEHKLAALTKELPSHIDGSYEKPVNKESEVAKELPSENCDLCHKMENRAVNPSPGVMISHKAHIAKGINCTTCHNRVAHPNMEGYENFMEMRGCFRCHGLAADSKAPGKCSTCHPPNFELKPDNHKAASWLGFTQTARAEHGQLAKQDRKYCRMCHLESFCTSCHGLKMPHPADNWVKGKKEHTILGKSNPAICMKCHLGGENFCAACHHKGYDPSKGSWIKLHRYQVDAKGAASCFECHGPTYCAYCHVRGQKPASIKGP
mgnify:CR=1 FL=1